MDWTTITLLVVVGGFMLWRGIADAKNDEKLETAKAKLKRDNQLYQSIKAGMREVNWQERDHRFRHRRDGELIFENAHMAAYHVEHFAESRVGFYFKDLDEYGLHGFFAGNGDDYFESYYRTDNTFQEEGRLLYDQD